MDSPPPSAADAAAAAAAPATGSTATAQVVGNAFVHQYYNILHQSPDHVYRFYQQASRIGRPAGDEMDTVTTMKAISDKIMSMDIVRAEIKAVDAQESLSGGVTVLVTGHLTRSDGLRREFAQSFFLAPQHRGYYVLNDILRYVGVEEQLVDSVSEPEPEPEPEQLPPPQQSTPEVDVVAAPAANGTIVAAVESVPREHEALPPSQQHVTEPAPHPQEADQNEEEIYNPPNEAEEVAAEETQAPQVIDEVPNNVAVIMPSLSAPVLQEEAPKKSYASIVKVMKEVPPSTSAIPSRPPPPKPEKQIAPAPAAPVADAATLSPNPESSNLQEAEVDAHAIYVRSLPLSATPEQLEEVFKKFGTIKPDGIQVRSHKIQGFCYGFVEFEDPSAVQSAIAGSPVMIGDRSCYVEEKRTAGSRGGGRGRFPPGRGGNFRVEGMRGRGNYTGGRNYGRGEFSYRSDYGGRGSGRGGSSRGGDVGYQRVDHSGATAVRSARVPSGTNAVAK